MRKTLITLFALLLIPSFCFGAAISTQPFISADDVTIASLEDFRKTHEDAINSADGGLLQSQTVTTASLDANANPENRWNEAFNNFVFTGLLPVTDSDLTSNIASGTAYVEGVRVVKDVTANTYTLNKITYVDLSKTGVYTFQETAAGADAPAVTSNSIRLASVSTDATTIASVTDLRTTSIVLTSTSALTLINDIDENTKVQTEESSNEDIIRFDTGGTERIIIKAGVVEPTTDDNMDLGSSSKEFKDAYIDGTANIDVLSVSGASTLTGATALNDTVTVGGTTPSLVIGDAGAEDAQINFDGDAQDFHIGLQDTVDDLTIGKGTVLGTTTHMNFTEDGEITKPLQPAFLFRADGSQTNVAAAGGAVNITWVTEIFDIGDNFATSTFTAPVTGKYLLQVGVTCTSIDSAATGITLVILTSNRNVDVASVNPSLIWSSDTTYVWTGSALMDMDATDTANVTIDITGGADQLDISTGSHFSGVLIN